MAQLNGKDEYFFGMSLRQIGERLLALSPSDDGKGLKLRLESQEEQAFVRAGGLTVGYTIATLIADAIEKRDGTRPTDLSYQYQNQVFTT